MQHIPSPSKFIYNLSLENFRHGPTAAIQSLYWQSPPVLTESHTHLTRTALYFLFFPFPRTMPAQARCRHETPLPPPLLSTRSWDLVAKRRIGWLAAALSSLVLSDVILIVTVLAHARCNDRPALAQAKNGLSAGYFHRIIATNFIW